METAVSIPDDVFEGTEHLAPRTKKSRSRLHSDAIKEYVARHAPEAVTEAMNRVWPSWRIRNAISFPLPYVEC
jgi:predicted transcriptional regulator